MVISLSLKNFIDVARVAAPTDQLFIREGQVIRVPPPQSGYCCEPPPPNDEGLNRKVWQVFLQAVRGVCDPRRFERICRRYSLNIEELQKYPLLSRHVEMFGVGLQNIYRRDLGDLQACSPEAVNRKIRELNPIPYIGTLPPAHELRGGVAESLWEYIQTDFFLMDKKRLHLYQGAEKLPFLAYLDRLGKAVVSHPMEKGMIQPAPGDDHYEVLDRVNKAGLLAYPFIPLSPTSQLPNLIVFRPSQVSLSEQAVDTWLNDLEVNIGQRGYTAAKEDLDALMRNPAFANGKPKVGVGFSLGGSHLQLSLVDHWREFSEAFFLNDPSIDPKVVEDFARMINAQPRLPHKLVLNVYRTIQITRDGKRHPDIAHCAGGKHLGWGIDHPDVEVKLSEIEYYMDEEESFFEKHSKRFFDADPVCPIKYTIKEIRGEAIHKHLDNSQRGEEIYWYEKNRSFWGVNVVFHLIDCLWKCIQSVLRCLGIDLFRAPPPTLPD